MMKPCGRQVDDSSSNLQRNTVSAFSLIRRATLTSLLRFGGSIVHLSVAAAAFLSFITPYGAAKRAFEGLVRVSEIGRAACTSGSTLRSG